MPTLESRLPPDAREHDLPLEYGLGLPKPGIYFTRHANGTLATVGLARDVRPPRGTIWTHDPGCHCTHVLRLEDDHRSGYYRSRTVGTSYRSDGMLVTANGWTEDDDVEPAGCDRPSWAATQRAKMVEWAAEDAAPGRTGPKGKRHKRRSRPKNRDS